MLLETTHEHTPWQHSLNSPHQFLQVIEQSWGRTALFWVVHLRRTSCILTFISENWWAPIIWRKCVGGVISPFSYWSPVFDLIVHHTLNCCLGSDVLKNKTVSQSIRVDALYCYIWVRPNFIRQTTTFDYDWSYTGAGRVAASCACNTRKETNHERFYGFGQYSLSSHAVA